MLTDSLIEEPLLRLTQRLLRELLCDLVPQLLDKANTVTSRQLAEGLDDLLRIHLRVTPARDGTADDLGSPPRSGMANVQAQRQERVPQRPAACSNVMSDRRSRQCERDLPEELRNTDDKCSGTQRERANIGKRLRASRVTWDHDNHLDIVVSSLAEGQHVLWALVNKKIVPEILHETKPLRPSAHILGPPGQ